MPQDADRRAYLAFLRHELRTPINAILGYSELLQEEAAPGDSGLVADLERIHAAGSQLLERVNRVLDPSALDAPGGAVDLAALEARLGHELRTPISSVMGYAELLAEEADAALLPDLQRIRAAGARLLDLVGDLARLPGWRQEPPEEVVAGISPLVRQAVAAVRPVESAPGPAAAPGRVLVVDDRASDRDLLARRLRREGYEVALAEDGAEALERCRTEEFDLVLLDLVMPEMSGLEVLRRLKADERLRSLPVVMLSALDEVDSAVRCIEMGAEDYLPKPCPPVLLRARIGSGLEKKRLRDREAEYLERLRAERELSERLLLGILPQTVVERLKRGESEVADSFAEATVLFADLEGFTGRAGRVPPAELVRWLDSIFSAFDALATRHGLEKIKTIGDAYLVAGGIPTPRRDHAEAAAEMALDMLDLARERSAAGDPFRLRIGMHSGPVVAGVIGRSRFAYDLWGETVNTASRLESRGLPGEIQVSAATFERLRGRFLLERRGEIEMKGIGAMETYLLRGRRGGA